MDSKGSNAEEICDDFQGIDEEAIAGLDQEVKDKIKKVFSAKRFLDYVISQELTYHGYLDDILAINEKRSRELKESYEGLRCEKERLAATQKLVEELGIEVYKCHRQLKKIRKEVKNLLDYLNKRRKLAKEMKEDNQVLRGHLGRGKKPMRKKSREGDRDSVSMGISGWERKLESIMMPPSASDDESIRESLEQNSDIPLEEEFETSAELAEILRSHSKALRSPSSEPLSRAGSLITHTSIEEWLQGDYDGCVLDLVEDLDNYDSTVADAIQEALNFTEEVKQLIDTAMEEVEALQEELMVVWEKIDKTVDTHLPLHDEVNKLRTDKEYTRQTIQRMREHRAKLRKVIQESDENLSEIFVENKKLRNTLPRLAGTSNTLPPLTGTGNTLPPLTGTSNSASRPKSGRPHSKATGHLTLPKI